VTGPIELWVKLLLSLLAAVVVARSGSRKKSSRRAGLVLSLLAIAAALAYYNLGAFHGPNLLHYGELFHYNLGAKYFPELGYDGLYAASVEAQLASRPDLPLQRAMRDLRTNTIVPTATLAEHRREVRARFAPERWRRFVADHQVFLQPGPFARLADFRLDHGYNPTPAWTFVGRLFAAWLPTTEDNLRLLVALDAVLLAFAFIALYKSFGARTAALALIVFGLGYAWRFTWVGGAFLRQDWLVAVVIGICMLERERFAFAGGLFAYAAAVRLFPVLFLLGLVVVGVRLLARRENVRPIARFALGFAAMLVLCFVAGSLTGRGPAAWEQFRQKIALHRVNWSTNSAGLELVFLTTPQMMTSRLPATLPLAKRFALWQEIMNRLQRERRPFFLLAAAALLLMVVGASWRAAPGRAAAFGVVSVFALLVLSCYYWAMLLVVPLRERGFVVPGLLTLNAGLYAFELGHAPTELTFGIMSWGLTALFLAWLLPDVVASVRPERPALTRRQSTARTASTK
jgi:hypothetical protein